MNSSQLFSGRAYVFDSCRKITKDNESIYSLIENLILDRKLSITIDEILVVGSNENFDEYIITSEGLMYTLKISLDSECKILKNEIAFLKENQSPLVNQYIDSGYYKLGSKILFLMCSFENGDELKNLGRGFILDNLESFFYTCKRFNEFDTNRSSSEYLDLFFSEYTISNPSKVLERKISAIHNIDDIKFFFKEMKEEVLSAFSNIQESETKCCHGFLVNQNVITKHGLFKFKNFSHCFKCDPLLDLCFLILSLGFKEPEKALLYKRYCVYSKIDEASNKEVFNKYMRAACSLFFCKIFFDFIIQEAVFENDNPQKLVDLIVDFSSSFDYLKHLKCREEIVEIIKSQMTKPITQID